MFGLLWIALMEKCQCHVALLLYDQKAVPETMLDHPVSWTAHELLLIRGVLGKTKHHIIDRWPLLG
uniref:Uncharacterized protein n=1 Tax=Rhizobium leguminosarum TaxID=384 RepID=A0A154IL65_RHILE|nr:hypothetical protein A4A59_13825 [Rhizobium leguminosarum]